MTMSSPSHIANYTLPTPPDSANPRDSLFAFHRARAEQSVSASSHYRTHSTCHPTDTLSPQKNKRRSRSARPSTSSGLPSAPSTHRDSMLRHKGSEPKLKESPSASSGRFKALKKKSTNALRMKLSRCGSSANVPPLPSASVELATPPASSTSSSFPSSSRAEDPPSDDEDLGTVEPGKYVPKDNYRQVGPSILHSYSAPYLQSYNDTVLENDKYATTLFNRVANGPSFYDYGANPPATILDLGCGDGHWALEATRQWPGSLITVMDMVDVPAVAGASNITLVRGDFVNEDLKFGDAKFDLVRLSCLSLAIDTPHWPHVIYESRRVLKSGGRLEIIVDELLFPYGTQPSHRASTSSVPSLVSNRSSVSSNDTSFDSSEEEDVGDNTDTLVDVEASPKIDELALDKELPLATKAQPPTRSIPPIPVDESDPFSDDLRSSTPTPKHDPPSWEQRAGSSQELEKVFDAMLESKQMCVHRPEDMIQKELMGAFGPDNARRLCVKRLHLPYDVFDSLRAGSIKTHKSSGSGSSKRWDSTNDLDSDSDLDGDSRRSSSEATSGSVRMPGKAAAFFGVPPGLPVQSKIGLKVSPGDAFLYMSPQELEFSVCRHIHTVLGCRHALYEYIKQFRDDEGQPVVSDDEFNQAVFDYECFRRERFNWPSVLPEVDFVPDDQDTPSSKRTSNESARSRNSHSSSGSSSDDFHRSGPRELEVRRIVCIEACKV